MADSIEITIAEKDQLRPKMDQAWKLVCKGIEAGPVLLTLGRPKKRRNSMTNARLHAMISDIQRLGVISMPGRRIALSEYDTDALKALLVIWFANEREMNGEPLTKAPRSIICPVTGERVSIRPSTADWGQKDACDFVDFLYSVGNDAGVRWSEPALKAYESMREAQ